MISALLIHGVPIEYINQAATTYKVPAITIISVLETEGGRVGSKSPNKNGTFDYGPMQINTIWINKIAPYGYSEQKIQYDALSNVMVGTWILSQKIARAASFWKGIGDYHSYTVSENIRYQQKVYRHYVSLERKLQNVS